MKQERNTAIVLAAGQGKRMHSKIQKQFLEIDHRPVLFTGMFSEKSSDPGNYSGNRRRNDFLL